MKYDQGKLIEDLTGGNMGCPHEYGLDENCYSYAQCAQCRLDALGKVYRFEILRGQEAVE